MLDEGLVQQLTAVLVGALSMAVQRSTRASIAPAITILIASVCAVGSSPPHLLEDQ